MSSDSLPDFRIISLSPLSRGICGAGITTFSQLTRHVSAIPYGRTTSSSPLAVLMENRGTCSSKHRLLAAVTQEFRYCEVILMVGIYDMTEDNTPGVGVILDAAHVGSIPEAHCYLKVGDSRFDFTGLSTGNKSPFQSLVSETAVLPADLSETKFRLHEESLKIWVNQRDLSLDDAWSIREACIAALSTGRSS